MKPSNESRTQLTNNRPLACFFNDAGCDATVRAKTGAFANESPTVVLDLGNPTLRVLSKVGLGALVITAISNSEPGIFMIQRFANNHLQM